MSMDRQNNEEKQPQVVRVSLTWMTAAVVSIFAVGIIGGLVGQKIVEPQMPPLASSDNDKLFTTVQEVTISPNRAAADMVDKTQRSVFLLGTTASDGVNIAGTAVAVTSDGLVATTLPPISQVQAYDNTGRALPLALAGQDELFGLTYYRLTDYVVVPLDMSQDDPSVGQNLLSLTRNSNTFAAKAWQFQARDYVLPDGGSPAGLQKVLAGSELPKEAWTGSPILDDEGKLAAVMMDTPGSAAIPVSVLRESFARVVGNQRELNPLTDLGLDISYAFSRPGQDKAVIFTAHVNAVTLDSLAATAGMKKGDVITKIGDQQLDWQKSVVAQLTSLPLNLTVVRGEQTLTVTVKQ